MRYSEAFIPTLKEDPQDAELVSHKLMVRAGMIRKVAAGVYSYLPLGLREIRKVENIIREEMNRAGAIELLMPGVQPRELWDESGRWEIMGKELVRFRDRHDREFCLGPTHEEVITDIIRHEIRSYRQLPINLYQIQNKFRDEIRPRFGLMRGREFSMKDAYSFDASAEGAEKSYWAMYRAYRRIFERCGLKFRSVEADTGNIGGKFSHEFMVLADSGEDRILSCDSCDYAANAELAEIGERTAQYPDEPLGPFTKVPTPGMKTVEEVTAFLKVEPKRLIKTLIFDVDGKPVAALVRGDHEANPVKVRKAAGGDNIAMADAAMVEAVTKAPVGFAGPHGLSIPRIADLDLKGMKNMVVGANEADTHMTGANEGRDFEVTKWADIRGALNDDSCPRCKGVLKEFRGIEVGHIFMLGTKYSAPMKATFLDASGKEQPFVMGSYGIGVGRTSAAAIEQNHDARGIIWPWPIAPFHVYILPVNAKQEELMSAAKDIHDRLEAAGLDVLLDDRDERAGVKFADADLIGAPLRITVGSKHLKDGNIEFKRRDSEEVEIIPIKGVVEKVEAYKKQAMSGKS